MGIKILKPGEPLLPLPEAEPDGLVAIGGILNRRTLISAYRSGIFPWYSEGEPVMWWNPVPRMVLFPSELHISKSMRKLLIKDPFRVTCDQDFTRVIRMCREAGGRRKGTWITEEMVSAYTDLFQNGFAHSVEVWEGSQLAGGLYGIALGRIFFGESMFTLKQNASKFGLIRFTRYLERENFSIIDCQVYTRHLASMGARTISSREFQKYIKENSESGIPEMRAFPEII